MALTKEERNRLILVLIWSVFALYLYTRFLVSPQLAAIGKRGGEIRRLKTDLAQLEGAEGKQGSMKQELAGLEREWKGGESAMLENQAKVLRLLGDLSQLAETHQVQITSVKEIKPQERAKAQGKEPEVSPPYQEHFLEFRLLCGYHDLGRFINEIERMNPALEVAELDIRSGGTDVQKHAVSLKVRCYVLTRALDV